MGKEALALKTPKSVSVCVCVRADTQSCPTLHIPLDYSPPGSSIHVIFQAKILEWVAISYSRVSPWPRDQNHISCVSCTGRQILDHCTTWETPKRLNDLGQVNQAPSFLLWESSHRAGVRAQREFFLSFQSIGASLVAQMVKNLPATQETQVRSLGQEDALEEETATHSSILAWRISWTEEPGGLQSSPRDRTRVGHNWATNTCGHFPTLC